jgi:hypothetical protein
MIDLKNFINESLLNDFDIMADEQDTLLQAPIQWLRKNASDCKSWDQLLKILKEFHEIVSIKDNGTEIKPKRKRPAGGLFSRYWSLRSSYKYGKNDLICSFLFDIDKPENYNMSEGYPQDILLIGFGKSLSLALTLHNGRVVWRKLHDITDHPTPLYGKVYYINPKSNIYSDYKEIADEMGI